MDPRPRKEHASALGVRMAVFEKPSANLVHTELSLETGVKFMLDSHITYDDVEAGIACLTTGITCSGQCVYK